MKCRCGADIDQALLKFHKLGRSYKCKNCGVISILSRVSTMDRRKDGSYISTKVK